MKIKYFYYPQSFSLMIDDFIKYFGTEWPNGTILPKLHMHEHHATDFVENQVWYVKSGRLDSVLYREQGGESIHNEFNQLKTTYCQMQPASRRLESMLQEHYRRIHPESKAVKFKNKFSRKRNTTLNHSQELNNSWPVPASFISQANYLYNFD